MTTRPEQEQIRFEKLGKLRKLGFAYPNLVGTQSSTKKVLDAPIEEKPEAAKRYTVLGRMVQARLMGKAAFIHLLDGQGKLQAYIKQDVIGEDLYSQFKDFDLGDILEVSGYPFVTKTGEKSLFAESVRLLSKCLIPLPEKWHGLSDIEARYRYRYVDLIANPDVRENFRVRAKIIREIRSFLDARDFLEVETPVLHHIPGGADAKPFKTRHNSLGCDMYLRIALELPLKKLVVGGLERVYEIGRVFRNEGLSKKHNPEFTMLEFYQAYATFDDLMSLTEDLVSTIAQNIKGSPKIRFNEREIDLTPPWPRIPIKESLHKIGGVDSSIDLGSLPGVKAACKKYAVEPPETEDWGQYIDVLWEHLVEPKLLNPVFITHHPFSISPLARKSDSDPNTTDRFELIIAGMEMANGFSELNDPEDQRERFEAQARHRGGEDAAENRVDEDFLRSLEYGLPPTAGEGIGIDRLTMLLTDSPAIRDVILFPQLKPKEEETI